MASNLRLFAILLCGYGIVFALFVPHYYYFDRGDYIVIRDWASPQEILLVSLVAGGVFAAISTGAFALLERTVGWLSRTRHADDEASAVNHAKAAS